jgi:hypothetical protein
LVRYFSFLSVRESHSLLFVFALDAMQNKNFQRTVQRIVTNIGSTLGFNRLQSEDSKKPNRFYNPRVHRLRQIKRTENLLETGKIVTFTSVSIVF